MGDTLIRAHSNTLRRQNASGGLFGVSGKSFPRSLIEMLQDKDAESRKE